jgi:hypothetical protein
VPGAGLPVRNPKFWSFFISCWKMLNGFSLLEETRGGALEAILNLSSSSHSLAEYFDWPVVTASWGKFLDALDKVIHELTGNPPRQPSP